MAAASSVPPVIPVMRSGARRRLPSSSIETSTSSTATSGSASWTRSTSSKRVVLPAYSTASSSHSTRCERLRSLIVSANGDLVGGCGRTDGTRTGRRDRDVEGHDAGRTPRGTHGLGLGGGARERDPAVAATGAGGLRDSAHVLRGLDQAAQGR